MLVIAGASGTKQQGQGASEKVDADAMPSALGPGPLITFQRCFGLARPSLNRGESNVHLFHTKQPTKTTGMFIVGFVGQHSM